MTTKHDERLLRYGLASVGLIALICGIYCEEDWRGRHAWNKLKTQLEAHGGRVDWTNYVPTPVPEAENVFGVPEMKKWFVGRGSCDLSSRLESARTDFLKQTSGDPVAKVTVVKPGAETPGGDADIVLDYDPGLLTVALASATNRPASERSREVIPLIVMDQVPLGDAIKNLARAGKVSYQVDAKVSQSQLEAAVSGRWQNTTAGEVLGAVLRENDLEFVPDSKSGIGLISKRKSGASEVSIEPAATVQLRNLLSQAVAAATNSDQEKSATTAMGLVLTPGQSPQMKPVRMVVRADRNLQTDEVAALFPMLPVGSYWTSHVQVTAANSNVFEARLDVPPCIAAVDYLKWSDTFTNDFDLIRESLKRPYAVMPGDYHEPVGIPIPNFVCVRIVSQTLTDRAKSHLLAEQPEEALKDLALVRELCRMMEGRPCRSSATLVATMINSAVTGLYADAIAQGVRLKAWREPELAALQEQLKEIDLPPLLQTSFEFERASHAKLLEHIKADEFERLMTGNGTTKAFREKIKDPMYLMLEAGPRGWVYQNLITMSRMNGRVIDGFDTKNRRISSAKIDRASASTAIEMKRLEPYNYLATVLMPNFTRAVQTLARNQCMSDEALVACGLERYHLAHGAYPKNLEALVPQYLDKLPTDIISGQPLKYRVKADGQFVLYSVGWNEKDDGGVARFNKDGSIDVAKGDWVWGN